MNAAFIKVSVRAGLVTAMAVLAYLAINQLLVYHYIAAEYYVTALVITALVTGMAIAKNKHTAVPIVNRFDQLTAKELHILSLIADGKTNKEIAAANFVEVSTVKTHINNIYSKLSVTNRKDAIQTYRGFEEAKSTLSPPVVS